MNLLAAGIARKTPDKRAETKEDGHCFFEIRWLGHKLIRLNFGCTRDLGRQKIQNHVRSEPQVLVLAAAEHRISAFSPLQKHLYPEIGAWATLLGSGRFWLRWRAHASDSWKQRPH